MSQEVTVRYLVPVFNLETDDYLHTGSVNDADFVISLRDYPVEPGMFDSLMEFANEKARDFIMKRAIHIANHLVGSTYTFLTVDITQPLTEDRITRSGTEESSRIFECAIQAFTMVSTSGFDFENSFQFRFPELPTLPGAPNVSTSTPLVSPYPLHLMRSNASQFRREDHDRCKRLFANLLERQQLAPTTKSKISELAFDYYKTTLALSDISHAFLLLMIGFEAMFKKMKEDDIGKASNRIGRLIAETKSEYNKIRDSFNSGDPDTFGKLRNRIAHGDATLDPATIRSKYPDLHQNVRRAILAMTELSDSDIRPSEDYYDELTILVDNRFSALASS